MVNVRWAGAVSKTCSNFSKTGGTYTYLTDKTWVWEHLGGMGMSLQGIASHHHRPPPEQKPLGGAGEQTTSCSSPWAGHEAPAWVAEFSLGCPSLAPLPLVSPEKQEQTDRRAGGQTDWGRHGHFLPLPGVSSLSPLSALISFHCIQCSVGQAGVVVKCLLNMYSDGARVSLLGINTGSSGEAGGVKRLAGLWRWGWAGVTSSGQSNFLWETEHFPCRNMRLHRGAS